MVDSVGLRMVGTEGARVARATARPSSFHGKRECTPKTQQRLETKGGGGADLQCERIVGELSVSPGAQQLSIKQGFQCDRTDQFTRSNRNPESSGVTTRDVLEQASRMPSASPRTSTAARFVSTATGPVRRSAIAGM
mgnify:CR=1 FL=1|jgi:hypothetical protein